MNESNFLNIFLALFLIMDPIGNISSFLAMVRELPPARQRMIILREMGIALVFMLLFNLIGEHLFFFLDLESTAVRLASGVILFLVAIKILFPGPTSLRNHLPAGEPFIIPMAIPLIAGPSLLATIMLFTHEEPSQTIMVSAIIAAWFLASVVLLLGPQLSRLLGKNGLVAAERLMAMILIMLAIQRFMEGVLEFIQSNHVGMLGS